MFLQLKFYIVQIIFIFSWFNEVTLRSKPFNGLVSIQNEKNRHLCGGFLFDLDFVITSASCLARDRDQFYKSSEVKIKPLLDLETFEIKIINFTLVICV